MPIVPTRSFRRRVIEYLVYIALSILVVVGVIVAAGYEGDSKVLAKWGGWLGTTAILFGYAVSSHRADWKKKSFWAVIVTLLVAHVLVWWLALLFAVQWKVMWFVFLFPVENIMIDGAILLVSRHHRIGG